MCKHVFSKKKNRKILTIATAIFIICTLGNAFAGKTDNSQQYSESPWFDLGKQIVFPSPAEQSSDYNPFAMTLFVDKPNNYKYVVYVDTRSAPDSSYTGPDIGSDIKIRVKKFTSDESSLTPCECPGETSFHTDYVISNIAITNLGIDSQGHYVLFVVSQSGGHTLGSFFTIDCMTFEVGHTDPFPIPTGELLYLSQMSMTYIKETKDENAKIMFLGTGSIDGVGDKLLIPRIIEVNKDTRQILSWKKKDLFLPQGNIDGSVTYIGDDKEGKSTVLALFSNGTGTRLGSIVGKLDIETDSLTWGIPQDVTQGDGDYDPSVTYIGDNSSGQAMVAEVHTNNDGRHCIGMQTATVDRETGLVSPWNDLGFVTSDGDISVYPQLLYIGRNSTNYAQVIETHQFNHRKWPMEYHDLYAKTTNLSTVNQPLYVAR